MWSYKNIGANMLARSMSLWEASTLKSRFTIPRTQLFPLSFIPMTILVFKYVHLELYKFYRNKLWIKWESLVHSLKRLLINRNHAISYFLIFLPEGQHLLLTWKGGGSLLYIYICITIRSKELTRKMLGKKNFTVLCTNVCISPKKIPVAQKWQNSLQ